MKKVIGIIIVLLLSISLIKRIGTIGVVILVLTIFTISALIYLYIEKLSKQKYIYGITDKETTAIIKDYKESNKFFKRNLEMSLDEELLFIYNIQQFLKSKKQDSTFKFLNDEITLSILSKMNEVPKLLVDSKRNYTHAKHYSIERVKTKSN